MALIINDNLRLETGKHVDDRYLNGTVPYTSTAQANSLIAISRRVVGLSVLINNTDYWYSGGVADVNLVEKVLGASYTAGNGLSLSSSNFKLGGTLTENTIIDGDGFNLTLLGNNDLTITHTAGDIRFSSEGGLGSFTIQGKDDGIFINGHDGIVQDHRGVAEFSFEYAKFGIAQTFFGFALRSGIEAQIEGDDLIVNLVGNTIRLNDEEGADPSDYLAADFTWKSLPVGIVDTVTADYTIDIVDGITYARPRQGSGLTQYSSANAAVVIQAAIDALTPPGVVGSSGGHISISRGNYTIGATINIIGWEDALVPYSCLKITGEGGVFLQTVASDVDTLKVNNNARVILKDFHIHNSGGGSCLLLDSDGASERSCMRSVIDNLLLNAHSTTKPAFHAKNIMELSVPNLICENQDGDAIIIETDSNSIHYGNSNFGYVRALASAVSPYAGIKFIATGTDHFNMAITIDNYECITAYYGMYIAGLWHSVINYVDIETVHNGIYCDNSGGWYQTSFRNNFLGGYLLINSGGKGIFTGAQSGANTFMGIAIEGDATVIPVDDDTTSGKPSNSYDLIYGPVIDYTLNTIARPWVTSIKHRLNDNTTSETIGGPLGVGIASTPTTNLIVPMSTTAVSSLRIPHGAAPTSPVNGDIWSTTVGLFGQVNGSSLQFATRYPSIQTTTSGTTITATSNDDMVTVTALAAGVTFANPTGTFRQGQILVYRVKDNGTPRTISWGSNFRPMAGALPTITVTSKTKYITFIYNSTDTKFDFMSEVQEA